MIVFLQLELIYILGFAIQQCETLSLSQNYSYIVYRIQLYCIPYSYYPQCFHKILKIVE